MAKGQKHPSPARQDTAKNTTGEMRNEERSQLGKKGFDPARDREKNRENKGDDMTGNQNERAVNKGEMSDEMDTELDDESMTN